MARLSPEVRQGIDETAELLRGLGHQVDYVEPPLTEWLDRGAAALPRGIEQDAASMAHPERLQRRTRGFARLGSLIPRSLLDRALRIERDVADRYNRNFAGYDVVMTPTMATPPPGAAQWEGLGALRTLIG